MWVERVADTTNLPDAVVDIVAMYPENQDADPNNDTSPVAAAMQCLGPQGINGCGFESQLESMYRAIQRTEQPGELNFGFQRPHAVLAIVFVTDEADCSYNPDQQQIFLDLNNTWSWEPGATSPTSAVCWNAGVQCDGDAPGPYASCYPVDRDINGLLLDDPLDAEEDAVLRPLSRYVDFVQALEDDKKTYSADQEVIVSVIGGVPQGYAEGVAELVYIDDPDQSEQIKFGIGAGCVSAAGKGLPPVRMREFAEAFAEGDDRNLFSICSDDYSDALEAIADRIGDKIKPACYVSCVADTVPETMAVEPSCTLQQEDGETMETTPIVECEMIPEPVLPPGETVCFVYRTDKSGQTATPYDDMDEQCVAEGWNLEFQIVRSEPAPPGTSVSASCELSQTPALDCPDVG